MNRRVVLKSRPPAEPTPGNFEIVEAPVPRPADGEILCRTIWLSLDPYMRGRMRDVRSYAAPVEIGGVMVGGTVSEVIESRHPDFKAGDFVLGYGGWQTHHVAAGGGRPGPFGPLKLDPSAAPISTALGVLGMPGMTAYVGLLDIGQPKAGETVVVSAAAGAVGSAVGQIAKLNGARVVGVAGSPDKCNHVVKELGFDACVSYRTADLVGALRAQCPRGIDVYFDNVGGDILDTVLTRINRKARIVICGAISQYNNTGAVAGPKNYLSLLVNRARMEGMVVFDYADRFPVAVAELASYLKDGRIKSREDVVQGLETFPEALIKLFTGGNFGKLVLQLAQA
jgi:NADPH-dependent curcumin reductase CurA